MTDYTQIEARLKRAIGLDARSMGAPAVAMAVAARMSRRGIKNIEEYNALLEASAGELQMLTEEMVVPETWFFRGKQPFDALAQWACNEWLPAHRQGVLRLLSMPCSSGEEPFSMVMALLDASVPPEQFVVEAVDISAAALERASKGFYGRNSFRGSNLGFRDKYFHPAAQGWQLAEEVRRLVHFRQANVLAPDFHACVADVIFCRNLLIYFDQPAQRRVIALTKKLLSTHGLVFVGHAEAYLFCQEGFEPAEMPWAFALRKRKPTAPNPKTQVAAANPPPLVRRTELAPDNAPPIAPIPPSGLKDPRFSDGDPESVLAEGQRLADAGRLEEAVEQCQAFLREHGPSCRAFCLLGLVYDASGKPALASEFYRKALYLKPDHYEALVHLALLAEKTGDGRAALQWHQRAGRVQQKAALG